MTALHYLSLLSFRPVTPHRAATGRHSTSAVVALACAVACGSTGCPNNAPGPAGTEVGNPADPASIDITLYDDTATLVSPRKSQSQITGLADIDQAWVVVERIRLRPAGTDCSGTNEIEFRGPFAVDLLAPQSSPGLAAVRIPAGDYCRIEIRWDAAGSLPGTPAELADSSFFISGTSSDGTEFALNSRRNDELRLDSVATSFTVADTGLFVALAAQTLFAGVDFGAAVATGGLILINDDQNRDLLDVFENNLKAASRVYDDDDGDGFLGDDERNTDDILAQ